MMSGAADVAMIVILVLACLIGVLTTAVRLPGTWIIVAAAAVYGWWSNWTGITGGTIWLLLGVALAAELVELLMSVVTARSAGASRQAAWGGLVGGIVGMFILTIPIPGIGTVIGALLGCFAGATIAEVVVHNDLSRGARVGVFAAIGFALGAALKIAVALAMTGLVLTSALCTPAGAPIQP